MVIPISEQNNQTLMIRCQELNHFSFRHASLLLEQRGGQLRSRKSVRSKSIFLTHPQRTE
jgi:hypothetical protein